MTTPDDTTTPDRAVLLDVQSLSVGYTDEHGDTVTLVDRVSFTLHEREVLCLVGESGSGKSVTMLAVLGLLPAGLEVLGGTVHYRGRDVLGMPEPELRGLRGSELAMIFQDPMTALNPVKRVGGQIGRALKVHDRSLGRAEVREKVTGLLTDVGVPDPEQRAKAYPHQWSGGMRQRAVIAMAMANEPSVLIADEPTTALDVTIQAQIMTVLGTVRAKTDAAMVLITHDLGLVAEVADVVCILYSGRVVERGSVWDVFAHPTHPYTAGLLGSLLSAEHSGERVYAIPGSPPSPQNRPRGCPFAPRCELPAKSELCTQLEPLLEDVGDHQWAACHFAQQTPRFAAEVTA
ncbi:ATP-binding cassette domain-containing protein [Rathayibacter sp. VKM Ac-2803]|uniref:ABC transporter ATP-binding protein n=1 Tax=unclassified Rathayibacter TaxID=2609250 RepID=UPI00135C49CF|nr:MULTISPECIES: ABC transporter ATP-binding protein [unclassified Rathayibacter]MWV47823.1 ATP-binding cassette domain-containing protein [Rathayibacter sp. VKM Ac-2803]MWV58965.1 ATP-binding cassette domain-containing protein [Rathayibacter sp. VKM Ac-2754]